MSTCVPGTQLFRCRAGSSAYLKGWPYKSKCRFSLRKMQISDRLSGGTYMQGLSRTIANMAGTRIICLGILMASCLAIFFYRGDMLISMSRDSLQVQSRTHLSMRALKKDHAPRMQAVRQRHTDTLPNIRHHAGDFPASQPCHSIQRSLIMCCHVGADISVLAASINAPGMSCGMPHACFWLPTRTEHRAQSTEHTHPSQQVSLHAMHYVDEWCKRSLIFGIPHAESKNETQAWKLSLLG